MTIEELKKSLSSLDLPKKRIEVDDPIWGFSNVQWLLRNLLIRNKGEIAQKCYDELKSKQKQTKF